jgi:hypothetical protein
VTSNINFISINENFPVPGQDNDTQVFRDNFDTIKRSLRTAKDEITDLQDNSARVDESNDFNKNQLRNLVLGKASLELQNYGDIITNSTQEIDFSQGLHHVLRVGASMNLNFVGFPGDSNIPAGELLSGMGKITLELYGDGAVDGEDQPIFRTLTFNQPNGTVVKTTGFPSPLLTVQSSTDPILLEIYRYSSGTIFIRYLGQFV